MKSLKLPGTLGSLDWSAWLYGLVSAFVGGGAGAVTAGVSVNLVFDNVKAWQTLSVMGITFLVSGFYAGLSFLHQQPLPPAVTVQKTTSSVEHTPAGRVTESKTTETTTLQAQ